jgi:hypothetical protein
MYARGVLPKRGGIAWPWPPGAIHAVLFESACEASGTVTALSCAELCLLGASVDIGTPCEAASDCWVSTEGRACE